MLQPPTLSIIEYLYIATSGASIPPKTSGANPPQSNRPSLFYGVRFQSLGKLQAPKPRSCDCQRQEAPRDYRGSGYVLTIKSKKIAPGQEVRGTKLTTFFSF